MRTTAIETDCLCGVLLFALLSSSCTEPHLVVEQMPIPRSTTVWVVPINYDSADHPYESSAPFEIATCLDASINPGDKGWLTFSKAELDFGDGTGWRDMTREIRTLWWHTPDGVDPLSTDYMTHYTYTVPGTYTIRGRLKYWTGEVVTDDADDPIVVLP